eukprot:UN04238
MPSMFHRRQEVASVPKGVRHEYFHLTHLLEKFCFFLPSNFPVIH